MWDGWAVKKRTVRRKRGTLAGERVGWRESIPRNLAIWRKCCSTNRKWIICKQKWHHKSLLFLLTKATGLSATLSTLNQAHVEYSTSLLCQRVRENLTINMHWSCQWNICYQKNWDCWSSSKLWSQATCNSLCLY